MKRSAGLALAAITISISLPTEAQQPRRTAARTATEVIVVNARQATLTEFELANAQGQQVGALKAPLAAGKRITIKLAKGAPCTMTVSASFDDEFENAGAQIDACKDKIVRFSN